MPEGTLRAFADHGRTGKPLSPDGGDCEAVITRHADADINVDALASRLQDEGAKAFVKSWEQLLAVIDSRSAALDTAR